MEEEAAVLHGAVGVPGQQRKDLTGDWAKCASSDRIVKQERRLDPKQSPLWSSWPWSTRSNNPEIIRCQCHRCQITVSSGIESKSPFWCHFSSMVVSTCTVTKMLA